MEERNAYNETQQVVLAILPMISSLLSILGSSSIVVIILKDRVRKFKKTYYKVIFAVSCSDLCSSISYSTSTFLLPSDTPGVWLAFGTQATCNWQGFMSQLGFMSCFYTAILAVYFFLTTKSQCAKRTTRVLKHHEWILLIIPPLINLPFALAGIFLELYNPLEYGIGCWIAPRPHGCDDTEDIECLRGEQADFYSWIFGGIWIFPIFAILIFCFASIYLTVRRQVVMMEERYSAEFRQATDLRGTREKAKQTAIQGLLYIGAFFAVYFWNFVARALEIYGASPRGFFAVSCLSQIFSPSQGTFNFFIFLRPIYRDIKKRHPDDTMWMAWRRIFGSALQRDRENSNSAQLVPGGTALRSQPLATNGSSSQNSNPSSAPVTVYGSENGMSKRRLEIPSSPSDAESSSPSPSLGEQGCQTATTDSENIAIDKRADDRNSESMNLSSVFDMEKNTNEGSMNDSSQTGRWSESTTTIQA